MLNLLREISMKKYEIVSAQTSKQLVEDMNKLSAVGWVAFGILAFYNGMWHHTMELHVCGECGELNCHECF